MQLGQLVSCFNHCFAAYNTQLVGGAAEPFYKASTQIGEPHLIEFRADYFSSALHEIAHWCIAGEARRKLDDYGYWYTADGRNVEQQHQFQQVEVKPQALEKAFTLALSRSFRVSIDNLDGETGDSCEFEAAVEAQHQAYLQQGFPKRAQQFLDAINSFESTASVSNV